MTQKMEKFLKAKEEYILCRKEQVGIIHNDLAEKGFTVSAGCGCTKYGGRGKIPRFAKPYDLSNWKTIDCEREGKKFLISFQAFDRDPGSRNYHVMEDRIGIYIYSPGNDKTADAIDRMLATDIDLPMDEAKMEKLSSLLNKIIDIWKQIEQMKKENREWEGIELDEELKCLVPVNAKNNLVSQISELC